MAAHLCTPHPPSRPWATHGLSRADQNPWPTVLLWEETDVGNVSHSLSFSSTRTRNKRANWHIIWQPRTEAAYRADIQPTTVCNTVSPRTRDKPLLFLLFLIVFESCQVLTFEDESWRSRRLYVLNLMFKWALHHSWLGLWHYTFITESLHFLSGACFLKDESIYQAVKSKM